MAILVQSRGERTVHLEAETLIGRSSRASLRLRPSFVSQQHAALNWSGSGWLVRDLGSHNGTWKDGRRLRAGNSVALRVGAILAFGHPDEQWELTDDSPPEVMLVRLIDGRQRLIRDTVLGLPSDKNPCCTLYKSAHGVWCFEDEEGASTHIQDGSALAVRGELFRFCHPDAIESTVTSNGVLAMDQIGLRFLVSSDEEFVELQVKIGEEVIPLGTRNHNHMLLTLARARLRDMDARVTSASCGWMYKDDLVSRSESPERIDNEVFRIRKHIVQHAPLLADQIIERRPRTRQLRIGVTDLEIGTK